MMMLKKCNSGIMMAMYTFIFNFPKSVQYPLTITCSKSTAETVEKEVINDSIPIRKMQISENHEDVKPIHGGGMTKRPPTGLSPITSTNIGISPPNLSGF